MITSIKKRLMPILTPSALAKPSAPFLFFFFPEVFPPSFFFFPRRKSQQRTTDQHLLDVAIFFPLPFLLLPFFSITQVGVAEEYIAE